MGASRLHWQFDRNQKGQADQLHFRHFKTLCNTMPRRKGYLSVHVETLDNYRIAFDESSKHKRTRKRVIRFEQNLEDNLLSLLDAYANESYRTSEYIYEMIYEQKPRLISKLPYPDHVQQHAVINVIEDDIVNSFIRNTFSCIKNRGPHDLLEHLKNDIFAYNGGKMLFYGQLDIHHFYANIFHSLINDIYRRKIKDSKVLAFIDEVVDSFIQGLPLGIKFSQLLANLYLSPFDWMIKEGFRILNNPEKLHYWTNRYISDKFVAARTVDDLIELSKGVEFLSGQFAAYLRAGIHYYRLADDIVFWHEDKIFVHIFMELSIMHLTRDYLLVINRNWCVRPVYEGIDVGGYKIYMEHVKARKRNKVALCRQVSELKKKGYNKEAIIEIASSRIGFIKHANSINLLRKVVGMETSKKRLGQKIRDKKSPWPDLGADRKKKFEDILFDTRLPEEQRGNEQDKEIELLDYMIVDSKIEKEQVKVKINDGEGKTHEEIREVPAKCLVIRYRWQGEEWYSFTGSSVLIDQANSDFSKEDLPAPTVVKILENKYKKKFYRFT